MFGAYAIICTLFGFYFAGPGFVFYFDKVKAEAEVYQLIDNQTVKLRYYHEKQGREISVSFDFKDMRNTNYDTHLLSSSYIYQILQIIL